MQSTEIQTLTLDAPVTTVTLLEDRAQVQRIGKVTLTAGLWRVTVDRVAPVLSDKSLRAEFTGAESTGDFNAKVNDVRVRRRMLIKESDRTGLIEDLKREWRSQYAQYQVLTVDRQYLEEQFEQIGTILAKALQELPIDAAWGQVDPMAWRSQIQPIFQRLRDIRSDILNTYHTQTQLQEAIARLVKRIQAEASPDTIYTAYLEADLAIAQTGEYELAFDYVVPNALWRPYHQAQLQMGDNSQLTFRTDGCVWQNTGEDWLNVDLVFSTARASLGTEPPLLTDDLLNIREKSKKIAVELRDQTVKTTGLGTGARTSDTIDLPSVDDGGEVRSIRATRKANILSNGRPYRVPLFQFQSSAKIEHVLMSELALQVVLKSEQTNNANLPILAGPVDLVRATEYVGRTTVSFIAPQEKFALGWGTDATMRVQRTTSQKRDKNHLTQWNTITNSINIFLSNIGDEVRKIAMTERVPVSELEKVKVEVVQDETSDRLQPDANGFCNWHLQLPPYSQAKVTLVYKVAAAPDVEGL